MIFVDKNGVKESHFVSLLEATKTSISSEYSHKIPSNINGNLFEDHVFHHMDKSAHKTPFEGHIVQTGAHSFPDIIAKKLFGVEVKMTTSDKWVSTGNSVLESTRIRINEKPVEVSQLLFNLYQRSKAINELIGTIPPETLSEYWRSKIERSPIDTWLALISKHTTERIDISELFKAGLK